jgi:dephospho-CoA kinase
LFRVSLAVHDSDFAASHDEMDAITSAVVGRFHENGEFLPMGIPSEAQLIVPRIKPLHFDLPPIICLAGKTGAGKSVVARYLALFYGFRWVRTRELIREILIEDSQLNGFQRMYHKKVDPSNITDQDLRDFGVLILEKYQQEPLRRKLRDVVVTSEEPLIIDSIRDVTDLDSTYGQRPLYIWFIDCSDPIINNRLTEKSKIPSFKGRPAMHPIDQKVSVFRERSDYTIPNVATLEDLRWEVDDAIFEIVTFSNCAEDFR